MKILSIVKEALRRLLKRKNGVFYINGPETLPPPLSHEEEADIISRLNTEPSLRSVLWELRNKFLLRFSSNV